MRKFKQGDKLKFIGTNSFSLELGEIITFSHYTPSHNRLFRSRENGVMLYNTDNFELVKEPVDLTKIGKPFGELDRETQKEILAAHYLDDKYILLKIGGNDFIEIPPSSWNSSLIYKVKPEKSPEQLQKESLQKKVEELQKEINSIVVPE